MSQCKFSRLQKKKQNQLRFNNTLKKLVLLASEPVTWCTGSDEQVLTQAQISAVHEQCGPSHIKATSQWAEGATPPPEWATRSTVECCMHLNTWWASGERRFLSMLPDTRPLQASLPTLFWPVLERKKRERVTKENGFDEESKNFWE